MDSFASGAEIFKEGSKGDKMFVVCSGEVSIERAGKVIESLSNGDIFGEMALIDGSPRSATARAKTDCRIAPITEQAFLKLLLETPLFALTVMRTLADRLRRANG
jgi:CRP-like cAMP-binding protein